MSKDIIDNNDALETHREKIRALALRLSEATFDALRSEAYSYNLVAEAMLEQVGVMLQACPDKIHAATLLRFVGKGLLNRAAAVRNAGLH